MKKYLAYIYFALEYSDKISDELELEFDSKEEANEYVNHICRIYRDDPDWRDYEVFDFGVREVNYEPE
jgi:hypothetical protein